MEEKEEVNRELRIIRIILDKENILGEYVVMELRLLISEYNKKKMLRLILAKLILGLKFKACTAQQVLHLLMNLLTLLHHIKQFSCLSA
jgi:hypothetical protein